MKNKKGPRSGGFTERGRKKVKLMFSCNIEIISCLTDSVKVICAVQGDEVMEPETENAPDLAPDAPARVESQRRFSASCRKSPRGGERPRRGSCPPPDNLGRAGPPGGGATPGVVLWGW